ncbi:hypothetical protein [Nocardia anaemiae]|uniref:hypothetical protein n=1 Tax=Nocardia anaemiae TaxID=263910 RepID=UPI0007A3944A|nr:hypothetical protein [Nocardia anaemiae]
MADTTSPDMTGKNVDAILDTGSSGLQFFAQLIERYKKAFGHDPSMTLNQIYARYDEQRGMNLEKLANTATALRSSLNEADTQWDTQYALSQKLETIWTGQAAGAAKYMFGQQLAMAKEDRRKARAALDAITTVVPKLRSAVQSKADHVHELASSSGEVKVDGKSPSDIDEIIKGANTGWSDFSWEDVGITSALGGLTFGVGGVAAGGKLAFDRESTKKVSRKWLDDVFKKKFEDTLTNFVDKCNSTDTAIKEAYPLLVKAMADLGSNPYPRPQGTSPTTTNNNNNNPTNTTTSGTTTSSTPGTTTTPSTTTSTPTTTTTTTPSATTTASNLLSGLSSLTSAASQLTSLGQTVGQGLTSLGTSIKDGIDNAVKEIEKTLNPTGTEDKDGDGKPDDDSKSSAEFDLAGKHLKFEMGQDGELKLVSTDADGKSHEYSMKLDENGAPVISDREVETEGEEPEGTSPDNSQQEQSTGSPGTTSGVPTGTGTKREEDGEHTPDPALTGTGEAEPEQPFDSGAQLAEAGPL